MAHWRLRAGINNIKSRQDAKTQIDFQSRIRRCKLISPNFPCFLLLGSINYKTFFKNQTFRGEFFHKLHLHNVSPVKQDEALQRIVSLMPKEDFLAKPDHPEVALEQLIAQNSKNKRIYEYLMANYLLTGDLHKFYHYFQFLNTFDYPGIPRHYEEALVIYMVKTNNFDIELYGRQVSFETRAIFGNSSTFLQNPPVIFQMHATN